MNKPVCFTILMLGLGLSTHAAQADQHQALLASVTKYRKAVVNFENVVKKTRGIRVTDRNLVDRFEKASKRVLLAAKNPRNLNRLRYEWRDVQPFQQDAEEAIFGKYTLNHDLIKAWQYVFYAQLTLEQEFGIQLQNPRHGNSVRLQTKALQPNQRLLPRTAGASLPDVPTDQLQFSDFYIPQSAAIAAHRRQIAK